VIRNGYVPLAVFKEYGVPNAATNANDDTIIESLVEAASRYIDDMTGRKFYPRIETRYYNAISDPQLWLDDDLLEVTTLTNGNDVAITSASYNLLPKNAYPKYAIRLIATSNIYWQPDSSASSEYVIDVLGVWGCHEKYATDAWKSITTMNNSGQLSAAATTVTLTSVSSLDTSGGQIIKIDSEFMHTVSVAGAVVTIERAANGSTAATHDDSSTVYLWQYPADVVEACRQIVNGMYKRRTGENVSAETTITAGGVLVMPRDIPTVANTLLRRYARFA